ncbi:MAG TPA: tRNA preQ1(34) S-adenosylmethionine ribosyltransferase-isomerase QueA [Candidatus Polarisedimenticolia bacterium]|nr:tRNA preQ1(34) S-adenosylmethionine ribosyltransferase-isomerase QueA [Candidatus Polarisedimenticolia bacterium]
MRLSDLDYALPEELIAQEPAEPRDSSRLMTLERATGRIAHHRFTEFPEMLSPGDLLVLNDTRVVPARLKGHRSAPGCSAAVEVLLVERVERSDAGAKETWRALVKGTHRPGDPLELDGGLTGRLVRPDEDDLFLVELSADGGAGGVAGAIDRAGLPPTPPYVRRSPEDPRLRTDLNRYQTIYAREPGAIAAPTAGLHFTPEILGRIRDRGIQTASLTLHVGPGTFQPVRAERIEDHRMHAEPFWISDDLARAVAEARRRGGRVVAVGTTVTRALEFSAEDGARHVRPGSGRCDLFIHPGYRFRVVDALLTNFHLPRSTLLILVAAFAGLDPVLDAYRSAVASRYRFYSYGDAMMIA